MFSSYLMMLYLKKMIELEIKESALRGCSWELVCVTDFVVVQKGYCVSMQIISWNIIGLGSFVKKKFLSKLIKRRKPNMVLCKKQNWNR